MPTLAILEEVDWFIADEGGSGPGYRHCDMCYESACDDIWAGKLHEEDWRHFVHDHAEGLTVCENCLEAYLKDVSHLA